jgi:hypothetical protein
MAECPLNYWRLAMLLVRRSSSVLALLCSACVLAAGIGHAAEPARPANPTAASREARVAQGVKVQLATPKLSASELARLRPDFEKLKPRARTNTE